MTYSRLLLFLAAFSFGGCRPDQDSCEGRSRAFQRFVADHDACTEDRDCVVIGDCGPNADFRSVNGDVVARARELMLARCSGAYDGPTYDPVCTEGRCGLRRRPNGGCGFAPPEEDAGESLDDASVDGDAGDGG